ncbi:Diphosphomevalonate decarboxylase [Oopsacas minuta]|uniref:Diphosphomevalonate decarboxylase n=1 Tax=Oopsacas minuta TaxID=111878 RepID=A0AAV7K0Y7_9METZ|nr:Diphosphomevalonate decarboxylase [Oopsacas minuta]
MTRREVECSAPVNIALIKYWGKRDENLILPLNSSLSITLDQEELCTTNYVYTDTAISQDSLTINGLPHSLDTPRYLSCLQTLRQLSGRHERVWIESTNNFPTAAGLASSAAGFACLVYSLAQLFQLDCELSAIARRGSGSACRSMYGGFVEWKRGVLSNGEDSIAYQVFSEDYWPELQVLILVVSDQKKSVSSSHGMQRSVKTSPLINTRAESIVPERIQLIKTAISERNFESLAKLTMMDSNQFHAICMDTLPPLFYLNEVSHKIINMVHRYNEQCSEVRLGYTFDAGPNACLLVQKQHVKQVLAIIHYLFPTSNEDKFVIGKSNSVSPTDLPAFVSSLGVTPHKDGIKYVIHTAIGTGPKLLKKNL